MFPSKLYAQNTDAAAAIAFCLETGNVGIGRHGGDFNYFTGMPDLARVIENMGRAREKAVQNCIAAGGLHGSCSIVTASGRMTGYTDEYRCMSVAAVQFVHEPLPKWGGETISWEGARGHGRNGQSAAQMALQNCLEVTDRFTSGETIELDPQKPTFYDDQEPIEIEVKKACEIAATICLK